MTSAQVVETSAATTYNSPSQEYTNPDNYTTLSQKNKMKLMKTSFMRLSSNRSHVGTNQNARKSSAYLIIFFVAC